MMMIILKSYGFGGVPRPSFRISHLDGSLLNLEGGGINIFGKILLRQVHRLQKYTKTQRMLWVRKIYTKVKAMQFGLFF